MKYYEKVPGGVEAIQLQDTISLIDIICFFDKHSFCISYENETLTINWNGINSKSIGEIDNISELDNWDFSVEMQGYWLVKTVEGIHAVKDVVFRANYREVEK